MRATKKTIVFLFISVFSWILFTGLVQSRQHTLVSEKPMTLLSDAKSASAQEKEKYIYVGMEKCASVCHNNKDMGFQYDMVKTSTHGNAFNILLSEKARRFAKKAGIKVNPEESRVCLKCHVTGSGLDSTFFAATYRKEDGVTCEACHKGAYITKTFIPKEEDCLRCHKDPGHKMHPFNFKENCLKIAHPRPVVKT